MSNTNHFREGPERYTQGSVGESEKGQVPAPTNRGISFSSCGTQQSREISPIISLYYHEQTDAPGSPRKMIWALKMWHMETWNFLFKKFNVQISVWANPARWLNPFELHALNSSAVYASAGHILQPSFVHGRRCSGKCYSPREQHTFCRFFILKHRLWLLELVSRRSGNISNFFLSDDAWNTVCW